jgi:hypothetical protein
MVLERVRMIKFALCLLVSLSIAYFCVGYSNHTDFISVMACVVIAMIGVSFIQNKKGKL